MKPLAIIIDLDGTLANCDHREELAKSRDWEEFHAGTLDDTPNRWCVEIVEGMKAAHPDLVVFFVTGRPEYVRADTEQWLMTHMSPMVMQSSELHMRPDDKYDAKHTADYKADIYRQRIGPRYEVLFAIDDHVEIIQMWRRMGLVALDCAGNDY